MRGRRLANEKRARRSVPWGGKLVVRLSDGDENFSGAIDGRFTAAFAWVLLGVGFAALSLRAAVEAKAWVVERGEFALDRFADAIGGDRSMHVREVMLA
jgi:hypothetical protein